MLAGYITNMKTINWQENPFDPVLRTIAIPQATASFTSVIDLSLGKDALYTNSSAAHHKALKKALQDGVTIKVADSIEDWRSYFSLYTDSLRRWRDSGKETRIVYSWDIFERIHDLKSKKLFLAQKSNENIAGIICFYHNRHAVAWHGSALSKHFESRPNNLLYWEAIEDARAAGYAWFDCNPSGGYEGVVQFKAHLGAKQVPARVVSRKPGIVTALQNLRLLHG